MIATEQQIQDCIVQGLSAHGYTVLVTSRRVKRCRRCGMFPSTGDGASRGIPDLLVTLAGLGPFWIGLEVKGPKTRLSPEQAALHGCGMIIVVRSWEEAFAAVNAAATRVTK